VELTWPIRLRIAAAAAVGVLFIGLPAWPLVEPPEPLAPVFAGNVGFGATLVLLVLALAAGFAAYFCSRPYGRQIAVLAVPSGLAVWALRSGSMATLLQANPTALQRQHLLAAMRWEPIFWLIIVAAGFAGVLAAERVARGSLWNNSPDNLKSGKYTYLNAIIALVASALIAQFAIRIFAQDVRIPDNRLGLVVGQPAKGQIVFAVLVSFGIAAFAVKKLLDADYIWPIISAFPVTFFATSTYRRSITLQHLVGNWPAVFFSNSAVSIVPLQMVTFATIGSIAGYWLAVRYTHKPEQEAK